MSQEGPEFDRSDAVLTTSQRERLVLHATNSDSEINYTPKHRERIRNRVLNGTKDLSLLFEYLEERDITQVFEVNEEPLQEAKDMMNQVIRHIENSIADIEDLASEASLIQKRKAEIQDEIHYQQGIQSSSNPNQVEDEGRIEELEKELANLREKHEKRIQHSLLSSETIENTISSLNNLNFEELPGQIAADTRELIENLETIEAPKMTEKFDEADLDELANFGTGVGEEELNRYHTLLSESKELLGEIEDALETSQLGPQRKEELVNGIGFYLRVCDILDESPDEIVREAIVRTYTEQQPNTVVGDVFVDVNAENLNEAARRGRQKLRGNSHLSSAELRAVAETDYQELASLMLPKTETEFAELILDNLEIINSELSLVDQEPKRPDTGVIPDAIAKNDQGKIIVIELKYHKAGTKHRNQLEKLIAEYGGYENAEGLLVTLDRDSKKEPQVSAERLTAEGNKDEEKFDIMEFRSDTNS
jgi:hypothetical protein